MKQIKIFLILMLLLLINVDARINITPQGDLYGYDYYNIFGYNNITVENLCIKGSACYNSFSGSGTVTSVSGDGKYVTGTITTAGNLTFNEVNLNSTIDARETVKVVDITNGLLLSSGTLSINQPYFNTRYNQTSLINSVNLSLENQITLQSNDNTTQAGLINTKLTATDQRYNETSLINYTKSLAFTGTTTKTLTLTMLTGTIANTFTDIDTTYSAGNGIGLSGTTFSVSAGTALTQDASGLSVTNNAIGNTQLEFDTGQSLTTTSNVEFNRVKSSVLNLSTASFNNYFCTNSTGFKWLGTNTYSDCLQ